MINIMGKHNTRAVGSSLKKVQRLASQKTNHDDLQEVAEKMMNNPEEKNAARQALYKIQESSKNDEEHVNLTETEERGIQKLLSKLSYVDSQLNRAIRNHTENMFGNYQGEDFGAHK